MNRRRLVFMTAFIIGAFISGTVVAEEFSGGGGSVYFGIGWPNSIDAASELANDLDINDESGNFVLGAQGFFQGHSYRIGGAFQAHGWAGVNFGKNGAEDDAAGVAALVGGLYGTYTIRYDRVLLNVGAIVGAGRCLLGYSLGDEDEDSDESVSTFFIEPQVSLGVATCRWFGVEFQLSAPIFILTEDLKLSEGGKEYIVTSGDMVGVNFSIKLTFGKIANL
ncbi:MAG: hypothetical protein JSV33_04180 [bacterium]|nr:MAG: hypothetical protein JSV33_04180 [bacterium]